MSKKQQERRRGVRRENRHERRQKQHEGGGEWECIKVPEGLEVFKPEKGTTYHIDVIPYIAGKYNKAADEGDEYFELGYPIYRDLGIEEKKFIAIGALLGVRDPVAEHFAQLRSRDAEWDDMKMFKHGWRQMMLVFVHEQAEKGLQFFETSYHGFGKLLDEEIKSLEEDYVDNFDDPDAGATLEVRFKAENIGMKNPWILASKINFVERENGFDADGDKKLAAEILEKAAGICLDDCLKIPTYDQLKAALEGRPETTEDDDDNGEDEPAPKGRRTRKAKPEQEPEEDEDDDDIPMKHDGDAAREKAAKGKGKKAKPEPEPEEEEEEEEEEEPAPKGKAKGKKAPPTAAELGINKGDEVEHDEHGTCTVLRVAKDGLTVTIMDEEDEIHKDIDPADLTPAEEEEPEPAPTKGKGKKAKPEPEPEEDDDEPAPKAKGGKGKAKADKEEPKDDGDWDDDWED